MAGIRPFRAIRPREELASEIAALPYDVYDRREAKEAVDKNPGSFLCIDRAETFFPDSVSTYAPEVYERAKALFWQWLKEGRFLKEETECYYIYELTMDGRVQTGIAATASIDDYENGVIKKHENTRAEKEEDRVRHVDTIGAQTGPIFLAYRSNPVLEEILQAEKQKEPLYDFTAEDRVRHRVFRIDDPFVIRRIEDTFRTIDKIYIADGHHRAASAVRVGKKRRQENPGFTGEEEFNFFLSVLFADKDLSIMDYNRVVKDLNGLTEEELLTEVKSRFEVASEGAEILRPDDRYSFSMYLKDKWYLCRIREEDRLSDPVKGLLVSRLQDLLLDPVLGIRDPKTDERIDFVGGIRGLKELERRCHTDCRVAFAMYPTSIGELFSVADAGLLMPPKSTWFEPKLRSGLLCHEI